MQIRVSNQVSVSGPNIARFVIEELESWLKPIQGESEPDVLLGELIRNLQDHGMDLISSVDYDDLYGDETETREDKYLRALAFVHKQIPEVLRGPIQVTLNWDIDASKAFDVFHYWFVDTYYNQECMEPTPSEFISLAKELLTLHGSEFFDDIDIEHSTGEVALLAEMAVSWKRLLEAAPWSPIQIPKHVLSDVVKKVLARIKHDPSADVELNAIAEKGNEYFRQGMYEHALLLFQAAALQGHAASQKQLGHCYEKGLGIYADFRAAANWYEKAAEQGCAAAQYTLGIYYKGGLGGSFDMLQAYKWLQLAADRGLQSAATEANALAASMSPSELKAARRLYEEAKENIPPSSNL